MGGSSSGRGLRGGKQEEGLVTLNLSSSDVELTFANGFPWPGLPGDTQLETVHTSQRRVSKPEAPFSKPWILLVSTCDPC